MATNTHFNGKSQVGKKCKLNVKEGKTWGLFQQEISSLGVLYSAKPLSLNGKEGTTSDSFQWEITIAGLSQWKKCRRSWTQHERWDNQGLISMGNNRFTIPGVSQWENITRSWTQQERRGNQGFISMGNYKFRSIKLEVRVSGYMDIPILNTYPARPLSLSMGKKGQPGTHFNGKLQ